MARNILTDEEINDFMNENYAYKPRIEDFMLDLMSATPMLLGFPMEISRPQAHKQLARSFLKMGRSNLDKIRRISKDILDLRAENPASEMASEMQKTLDRIKWINRKGKRPLAYQPEEITAYKEFMLGLKNVPQELLDPLETIRYEATGDYGGMLETKRKRLNLSSTAHDPYSVLAHELVHVEDLKGHLGFDPQAWEYEDIHKYATTGETEHFEIMPTEDELRMMDDLHATHSERGFIEGKAYEAGDKLGPLLREGHISHEDWLTEMNRAAQLIEDKYGRDVMELDILHDYVPGFEEEPNPAQFLQDLLDDIMGGLEE